MNRVSYVYKIIAAFTALCVECTSLSIPLARAEVIPQSSPSIKQINPELLKLPTRFGEVVESHAGNGSVIVIQDAHAIPDAQKNIANIIKHLQREYGVGTVALEGASGDLDPQIFRSFPDKKLLREVMKGYMDAGEIAGGTAAAIFDETSTKYQGVENWEIYEEGLGLYLSAMEKETLLLEMLSAKRLVLNAEKEKAYPEELLAIDQAVEKFYENAAQLTDLIKALGAVQAPQVGSELEALWKEVSKQTTDQRLTTNDKDIEVRALAAKVEKVLKSPGAVKQFNSRKQEWMTGEISAEAFAMHLQQWAEQSGLSLEMSSDLLGMVRDQQTLKGLEGTKLFRDLEIYIQSVKAKLIVGSGSSKVVTALNERTESLRLIARLAKLELPRQEWSELSKGKVFEALSALEISQDDLVFHLAFYLNAEERDEVFFKNLKQILESTSHNVKGTTNEERSAKYGLRRTDNRTAIIVAGGFHAEGITSRLKEMGMGYALVMPKINHIPESLNYRSQMRGEVSWKNYFEVENGRIHLYKAFVRATRDQLLRADSTAYNVSRKTNDDAQSTNYALLKSWRDQIIRDLSDMGKVDRAAWYTRYMDEVVDDTLKSTDADKLMGKVDNFIRGLRGLEKNDQLNSDQIAALLKSNMIAPKNSVALVPGALSPVVDSVSTEVALGIVAAGLGVQAEGELPIAVSVPAAKLISKKLERITDQGSKQELIIYEDGTFELTQDGVENPLRAGRIFQVGRTQIALFHGNREYLDVQSSMINFAPVSTDSPEGIDTFLNMDYEALTGEGVLETLQPVAENILKLEGLADLIVVQAESGEKSDKSKQRGRVYRQLLRRYQVPFEDIEDAVIRVSRQNLETLIIKFSARSVSIEQSRSETRGSPETVNFFLANSSARTKSSAYEVVGQVKLKWPQAKIKIFYDLKDNLDSVSGLFSEYGDIEFSVMESSLPDLKDAYAVIIGPVSNISRLGELAKSNKVIHVQPNLVGVSKYLDVLTPVNESAILSKYRLSNKPIVFANLWAEKEFRLAAAAVRELFENSQFNLAPIILSPRFVNSGNIEKIKNILNENGIRFNLMQPGFSDGEQVDLTGKFVTILNTEGDQPEILKVASLTVAGHTLGEAGNPSHNVLEARSPIITGDISYVFPEQWDEEGMKEANDIIEGALQSGFVKTLGPNPDPGVLSGAIVELLSNKSEYERMKALNLKARTEAYEAAIRETDMNFDKWQPELDKLRSEVRVEVAPGVDQFETQGGTAVSIGMATQKDDRVSGRKQPHLLLLDLDQSNFVQKGESHLFHALFFSQIFHKFNVNGVPRSYKEIQDALIAAKASLNNAEGVNVDSAKANLEKAQNDKAAFLIEAQKLGFEEFLLKGDYGILSRPLYIAVPNEEQRQRVLRSLWFTFVGQDRDSLKSSILKAQGMSGGASYSEADLEAILGEFEKARSFTFPGGVFHGLSTEETLEKLGEFIQVQAVDSKKLNFNPTGGDGRDISVSYDAEGFHVIEGKNETVVGSAVFSSVDEKVPQWGSALVAQFRKAQAFKDGWMRTVNLGTGDPTDFSGAQDYTHMAFIKNGKTVLVDPSIRTIRNLERLGLMDQVSAIQLTHVHYDHVGGLLDLIRRKVKAGKSEQPIKLLAPYAVYSQLIDLAAINFGEELRDPIAGVFDFRAPTQIENKVEVVEFDGMIFQFGRTYGHPLPTYGVKITNNGITTSYLSDSTIPPQKIKGADGKEIDNPRYKEFIEFFGGTVENPVDVIISENGVPGVHITPEQLAKAFPRHAQLGLIYTVHSAGPQTQQGLIRFMPGMILQPKKFFEREADIEKNKTLLLENQSIKEFLNLTPEEAGELAAMGTETILKADDVVLSKGASIEDHDAVHIILEGEAFIEAGEGNRISVKAGHVLGEMALLTKALTRDQYNQLMTAFEGDEVSRKFFDDYTYDIVINNAPYRVIRPDIDLQREADKVGLNAVQRGHLKQLFEIAKSGASIPRTATVRAGENSLFLSIPKDVFLQFLTRMDTERIDPNHKAFVDFIKGKVAENLEFLRILAAESTVQGGGNEVESKTEPTAGDIKRSEARSADSGPARDSYERYKLLSGTLADFPDPVFVNDGETITLRIPHDEVEGSQPELDLLVVFKKFNGKVFFAHLESFSDLSLLEEYYRSADPLQEGSRVNWEEVNETSEVEIIGREEEMDSEGTKVKIVFSEQGFTIANASISDVYYFEGKPGPEIIASALRDSYLSGASTGLPIATEPIFIAGEDATEIFNLVTEFINQGPYVPAAGETAFYTKVKQQIRLITERTGEKYRFNPMIQINALSDTYRALNNFLMNRFTGFEGLEKGVVVLKRIPNLEKLIEVLRHLISAYELAFNHLENSTIEIEADEKENHRQHALQMLVELKKIVNSYDSIPPAERSRAEIQGEVRMARLPSQKNFSELISYNGDKIPLWAIKRIYLPDNRVIQFGEISQANNEDGVYDREDRTRDVRNALSPFLESAEIVFELQDGVLLKRILEAEEYETITAVYPVDFDPKEFSKLPHGIDLPERRFINAVNVNGFITTLYELESLLPETGLAGRTVTFFYSANNHLQAFKISDEAKPQSEQYVYSQFRNSSNVQPMSAPFSAQETQEIAKKDLVDLFADLFNRRALTSAQRVVPLSALILQFLAVSLNARVVSDWAQEGQVPLLEVDLANEQTISFSGLNPALHHDDAVRIERLLSQIDGGLDAASFRIVLAPAGPATQSNQAGQFFDRPGRGLDEFNAWHKLSDVLELFFLSVGETGKDKKLDAASKQKLLDKLAELVEAIAMIHPSVTGSEIYHTLYAVMDASTFRAKKLDTGSRINVLINLARQIRVAAPQDPQQSIYVQGEFESKLKTPNLDLKELAKETARSEARSADQGQAREASAVAESVHDFFKSPAKYSAGQINALADEIQSLADKQGLDAFINILRSIAQDLAVRTSALESTGILSPIVANIFSKVETGRMIIALSSFASASNLEKPTVGIPFKVTDQQVEALKQKLSPELSQLLGGIQLQHENLKNLGKLFQDKGITPSNIDPKLANAVIFNEAPDLEWNTLPGIGVLKEPQQFDSELEGARIHLQILIASYLAVRFPDKKMALTKKIVDEINQALFQLGEAQEGIIQIDANGRLVVKQSSLLTYIQTLFKAQTAVAVAA